MKFSITVNMFRTDPSQDMQEVLKECLELVQIADEGGFDIAFTAEHHTIETTISPNPFPLLVHWGEHAKRIRLGTGIISAPYWHPIRLAGEAALTDLILEGRLELGIGRGSYQYEFDRMADGMPQGDGGKYLREITPLLPKLWAGDYAHNGDLFKFPNATSVPKPLQKGGPPIWIAARDPNTFDFAVRNGFNIMSTPLQRPYEEVVDLCNKFETTVENNPTVPRPEHMLMRRACVYENEDDWEIPVNATIEFGRYFENLFKNLGDVKNGFTEPVDFDVVANKGDYSPEALHENMIFGTPEQVIEKLTSYQLAGVNNYMYLARFGVPHKIAKRSLELFCRDVIPHFQKDGVTNQPIAISN